MLVDHVLPVLPPYEFSLYSLLLRRSHLLGSATVVVGKRTLAAALGRGTRASSGNYQHITEKLVNLARDGFIRIGGTDRAGTSYEVSLPSDVPVVRERIHAAMAIEDDDDWFTSDERRVELFVRDNWRCRYCGELTSLTTATLDHVVPQSMGGTHAASNLVTCCLMCNSIKCGRTYEEAAPALLERLAQLRRAQR